MIAQMLLMGVRFGTEAYRVYVMLYVALSQILAQFQMSLFFTKDVINEDYMEETIKNYLTVLQFTALVSFAPALIARYYDEIQANPALTNFFTSMPYLANVMDAVKTAREGDLPPMPIDSWTDLFLRFSPLKYIAPIFSKPSLDLMEVAAEITRAAAPMLTIPEENRITYMRQFLQDFDHPAPQPAEIPNEDDIINNYNPLLPVIWMILSNHIMILSRYVTFHASGEAPANISTIISTADAWLTLFPHQYIPGLGLVSNPQTKTAYDDTWSWYGGAYYCGPGISGEDSCMSPLFYVHKTACWFSGGGTHIGCVTRLQFEGQFHRLYCRAGLYVSDIPTGDYIRVQRDGDTIFTITGDELANTGQIGCIDIDIPLGIDPPYTDPTIYIYRGHTSAYWGTFDTYLSNVTLHGGALTPDQVRPTARTPRYEAHADTAGTLTFAIPRADWDNTDPASILLEIGGLERLNSVD